MIEKLRRYKLHHILFWVAYYVFWVNYYAPNYSNINDLYGVTAIYLFSHASLFYLMRTLIISNNQKRLNTLLLIVIYLGLCLIFSLGMYLLIYLWLGTAPNVIFQASFQQTILFFSTANFFTVGTLLVLAAFSHNRKQQRLVEVLEKERLETELQYLKAQVNPHFLFNTINSIYVLIKINPDKASETLIKLSNLLRAQLYEFTEDSIPIEKEIEYLENYLELEKIRKGNRLDLKFEKNNKLEGFSIAPMMLIPFLENCFKHLSTHTEKANIVQVKIECEKDELKASFYNTKEKCHTTRPENLGGIGLANIKRRLDLVYPKRYNLEIKEGEKDFLVNLTLKLKP